MTTKLKRSVVVWGVGVATFTLVVVLQITSTKPVLGQTAEDSAAKSIRPLDLLSAEERSHYSIMEPEAYATEVRKYCAIDQIMRPG